jgi:predicted SnoaL-like aldol condensation-catalyzing enzyme
MPIQYFVVNTMKGKSDAETSGKDTNRIHKANALEFLHLIARGRPKDGLRFFAPDCRTHNPYVAGGMDELIDAMIAVQKQGPQGVIKGSTADFKLTVRSVLADADLVAVHTTLASSNPGDGGLRQVHLFRFRENKIVEYWDITQQVPKNAPNAARAFS